MEDTKGREERIRLLENRVSRLEKQCDILSVKYELYRNRSLMYQKMLSHYITEGYYNEPYEQPEIDDIMHKAKRAMVSKDFKSLLDERSMLGEFLVRCFNIELQPFQYKRGILKFDVALLFGIKDIYENSRLIVSAKEKKRYILFAENGFLSSIVPDTKNDIALRYRLFHSVVFDRKCMYFDARHCSDIENMLNSRKNLTEEEMERARNLIMRIVEHKLSKYNHQPVVKIEIGQRKHKVLVVDQVWGDASISYGLSDEKTFGEMLRRAKEENPNSDIIVKTHPDTNGTMKRRHYDFSKEKDLYVVDYDLNPYSLLDIVEKVYVCSSQLGFEALMAGKEVHCFGMPFYAGWGVTIDNQICERRTRKRSVEDIFYFFYIRYTRYVSYVTNTPCEIEDVIDELIELRKEYWLEYGIG